MTEAPPVAVRADPGGPVVSVGPITLSAPDRGHDLQVRVCAPTAGHDLPVVVFSHGLTTTMDDYAPLAEHWAAHGLVVVRPTHLDAVGPAPDLRAPRAWSVRAEDLSAVLDQLDTVEAAVPGLAGRLDRDRVAAAGHSWGAQTASTLAGARVLGADGRPGADLTDARVRAAVLLCLPGTGGADISPSVRDLPFLHPDFTRMTTPSLVVAGDRDDSPLSVRGPDWFADGYRLAPGATDLLTLSGGEHWLGGIQGAHDARTTDGSPERVAVVQQLTLAYLRTALGTDPSAWPGARAALRAAGDALGTVESR